MKLQTWTAPCLLSRVVAVSVQHKSECRVKSEEMQNTDCKKPTVPITHKTQEESNMYQCVDTISLSLCPPFSHRGFGPLPALEPPLVCQRSCYLYRIFSMKMPDQSSAYLLSLYEREEPDLLHFSGWGGGRPTKIGGKHQCLIREGDRFQHNVGTKQV